MTILRTDKIAGLESVNAITGSVHFPNDGATGTGDYLRVDRKDNSDFNLGTNDFTMEFWFNSENVGSTLFPFAFAAPTVSSSSDAGFYARFDGGGVNFNCFEGNNTIGACTTGSVNAYTWYHVAYVRKGSTFTIYLDGTAAASASSAEAVNYNAGWNFNIGSAYSNVYHYNGFLSNLRIVNGKALYTSNFTVPTRQLEVTPETVLLCCHSSQDHTQEATGKTLTPIRTGNSSGPLLSSFIPDVGNDHTHGTVLEGSVTFDSLNYMTLPRGTTTQSNRGRGLLLGGYTPTPTGTNLNAITYIDIASSGHDVDFGDLTLARYASGAFSSSTRAIVGGGRNPSRQDRIDYVTIAQTGNAIDFGNLHTTVAYNMGASNQTRGLFFGGNTPTYITRIDYVTIASSGMDALDFGDLTDARHGGPAAASPTKAVCMGGYDGSSFVTRIDSVTIATTGSEATFGELSTAYAYGGGVSNATRAIAGGGANPSGEVNHMEYITFATSGNGNDFGDLLYAREHVGAVSNSTRGVWFGGVTPTYQTDIQYAIIASTGSAANWGDLYVPNNIPKGYIAGASDSHGGLI